MKVTITIDCDNDAFEYMPGDEVARILRETAKRFQENHHRDWPTCATDYNGNKVAKIATT